MVISTCLLCKKKGGERYMLTNGKGYHTSCYSNLLNKINLLKQELVDIDERIKGLKERERKNSIKIISLILRVSGSYKPDQGLIEGISNNNEKLVSLKKLLAEKERILEGIYDYWPDYPPDWDKRKQGVRNGIFGNSCVECGSTRRLHVHHEIPLSKGGSNKINNLSILCEKCHLREHRVKSFPYKDKQVPSILTKKIQLIESAIHDDNTIDFEYKKYEGERSRRKIKPEGFKQVGASLCVFGYCYLRKSDRIFAVKRMT